MPGFDVMNGKRFLGLGPLQAVELPMLFLLGRKIHHPRQQVYDSPSPMQATKIRFRRQGDCPACRLNVRLGQKLADAGLAAGLTEVPATRCQSEF